MNVSPNRRWRRVSVVWLVGLVGLLGLTGCVDAVVHEVRTSDELTLEVILDTCNADVSVDVEEYDDRIVIHATHHDWYRYLTGSDDCQDGVCVDLERPLGDRRVTNSSGDEIVVTQGP